MKLLARIVLGIIIIIFFSAAEAGFDITGLNEQVQAQQGTIDNHTQRLDNLEPRVTNNEKDIKTLQENTNTPPADSKATVPVVEVPVAQPAPEASPQIDPSTDPNYTYAPYPNGDGGGYIQHSN